MQLLTMRPQSASVPMFRTAVQAPKASTLQPLICATPKPQEDPTLPRDIASRFGRRVRELRQAKGMTQVEVAVHFGIDRTFISDVERGRKAVCLPTMEVFALGFGVSLSDLLRGI